MALNPFLLQVSWESGCGSLGLHPLPRQSGRGSQRISTGAAWALCQVWLSGEPHTCPLLSRRIHFYEWACQLGILSTWGTRPGLGKSESSRIIEENWLLSSPGFPNAQLLKHQTGGGGDVGKKANTTSCAVCVAPLSTTGNL